MKYCFITSIISDDPVKGDMPGTFNKNPDHDYFMFTNHDKETYTNSDWDIITIEPDVLEGIESNVIKSRYMKFMGWHYIRNRMKKNYDMIVYVDGIYVPNTQRDWNQVYDNVKKYGLVQKKHKQNKDAYEECACIVKHRKDSKERMSNMIQFLETNNYPNGQFISENNIFAYDMNNQKIIDIYNFFWENYTKNISHRDQPMWSYSLWKMNFMPKLMDLDKYKQLKGKRGFKGHKYV